MKISEPTPQLTLAASAFAALGSEQRLAIVKRLVKAGPSGLAMADLGDAVHRRTGGHDLAAAAGDDDSVGAVDTLNFNPINLNPGQGDEDNTQWRIEGRIRNFRAM